MFLYWGILQEVESLRIQLAAAQREHQMTVDTVGRQWQQRLKEAHGDYGRLKVHWNPSNQDTLK